MMTRQTIRFEKACGFEDELTHDVVVEREGDCTYLWIPDADLSECTYADSIARIVFTRSEWQKLVSVEDAPITEAALQAAGWIHDLDFGGYRFDLGNHTFVAVIIDSRGVLTWIVRELNNETSVWIEMPGCTTMAQLAALVAMLTGAE